MSGMYPLFVKRMVSSNFQQYRNLPRWSGRRALRVINPEDYDEQNDKVKESKRHSLNKSIPDSREMDTQDKSSSKSYPRIDWKRPKDKTFKSNAIDADLSAGKPLTIMRKPPKPSKVITDMLETVIDPDGNFVYTKMSKNDPRISKVLTDIKSRKEKIKNDLFLLEGKRLIKDALLANCKLEYILFSRKSDLEDIKSLLPKIGTKLYKMPYSEIQMWSDLTTSPGVMGVFKIPNIESYISNDSIPLTVICDNVREPSNLGAILRTCSGVGCDKVILTNGCVNVWDSKVLRSAAGAHFRLQIHKKVPWENIPKFISESANIYIADNNIITSEATNTVDKLNLSEVITSIPLVPYFGVTFNNLSETVLIVGGETEGISEESYNLAHERNGARLNVPLSNKVESLNTGTALGIISFEIKRQFILSGNLYRKKLVNKQ